MLYTILVFYGNISYSQILPIKTITKSIEAHIIDFGIAGSKLCVADKVESNIKIYNSDFTIWKTLKIPRKKGYEIPIVSTISDNLFNKDSLIEFICQYNMNSDPAEQKGRIVILNENGEVLLSTVGYQYQIKSFDTKTPKLVISDMYVNQEVKVYDLPGKLPSENFFWGTYRFPL